MDKRTGPGERNLNEILLSWTGPSHPYKKRSRTFYQTLLAFAFLLSVIAFFLSEYFWIVVIVSAAFFVYVLSTMPPVDVFHKITPIGIEHAGKMFRWQELYSFWFEEKWGQQIFVVQTNISYPGQIRAIISPSNKEKLKEVVGKYLLFMESPSRSFSDKLSSWFGSKIPLEV